MAQIEYALPTSKTGQTLCYLTWSFFGGPSRTRTCDMRIMSRGGETEQNPRSMDIFMTWGFTLLSCRT